MLKRSNKLRALLFFVLGLTSFFVLNSSLRNGFFVQAENVDISASVIDNESPSTPILISPTDGALINDATPEFLWYESTDNIGVTHYILHIDSTNPYGDLPLTSSETDDYIFTYDGTNGIYSLIPKSNLFDGIHSWRVEAYDAVANFTTSDTWDFTIDTLAPTFVINQIGDKTLNISASDPGSVPTDPIEIFAGDPTANEPTIYATGESNSNVSLVVTIPGDPIQNFNKDIEADGSWELQLGILPRDTVIRLDFVIVDQIAHVSVLGELYIIIPQAYWPTGTTTPTDAPTGTETPTGSPTETPSVSPSVTGSISPTTTTSPEPSVSPTEGPTVEPSGIQIPIIPPKEIVHEASQEIVERLPEKLANFLRYIFSSDFWLKISIFFSLFLTLLLPFFAYLAILTKFIHIFSPSLLKKILFLILPIEKLRKNLVFNYRKTEVSPLVKVELIDYKTEEIIDFHITDHLGNFADFNWPINQDFKLKVNDKNFYFPIGDIKPVQLSKEQFYQDEVLRFKDEIIPPILIPTLMAQGQEDLPFFERVRIILLYLMTYPWVFYAFSFFPVLIIALRYPSVWNSIALFYYLFVFMNKILSNLNKVDLKLEVLNKDGQKFSSNIISSLFDPKTGDGMSMVLPVEFSIAKDIKLKNSDYVFSAFLINYAQWDFKNAVSSEKIKVDKKENKKQVTLKRIDFTENSLKRLLPISKL